MPEILEDFAVRLEIRPDLDLAEGGSLPCRDLLEILLPEILLEIRLDLPGLHPGTGFGYFAAARYCRSFVFFDY